MKTLDRQRATGGFTLVELMAVMVIIAVLAAMILGVAEYAKRAANEARAKGEIEKLKIAAQEYKMDHGSYPSIGSTDAGDLWAVAGFTDSLNETVSKTDPWGNPYQYTRHSRHSGTFHSFGHDGVDNTADDLRSGR
jgi:general secretion pathway protein G